jgi:F0F1-type ATP synthase membrane subunit c/vacuolar-type H+-ATPase subunit K
VIFGGSGVGGISVGCTSTGASVATGASVGTAVGVGWQADSTSTMSSKSPKTFDNFFIVFSSDSLNLNKSIEKHVHNMSLDFFG